MQKKTPKAKNHFFLKNRFIKSKCRIYNPLVNGILEAMEVVSGISDMRWVLTTLTVLFLIKFFKVRIDFYIQLFFIFYTVILTFFCFCRLMSFDEATIERALNTQQFLFPFFSLFDELGDRVRFKSNPASVNLPLVFVYSLFLH